MKYEGMIAETVLINGHEGDQIDAYLARPLGSGPVGAVVLIHHMPGWDAASKEMARKLAYNGFATISPNWPSTRRKQVIPPWSGNSSTFFAVPTMSSPNGKSTRSNGPIGRGTVPAAQCCPAALELAIKRPRAGRSTRSDSDP